MRPLSPEILAEGNPSESGQLGEKGNSAGTAPLEPE